MISPFRSIWLIVLAVVSCGQPAGRADYTLGTATDGGTGKQYFGREIALPRDAPVEQAWFDRPSRETEELSDRLLEALQLRAADHVADIGSGTGFYAVKLAHRVPSGRVFAVDVDPAMLDTVASRAARGGITNIVPTLGTVESPALPEASLDLALIVVSYHEFSHPREMLAGLFRALKPGGRLVLVEYRGEDDTLPVPLLHRMTEAQIRKEVRAAGFEWRATRAELAQQHLVVFARPS